MKIDVKHQPEARPKLSVCIPTYNRSSHLEERLTELARQVDSNIEVIISNNASSDGTSELLRQWETKWPTGSNLRIYQGVVNEGFSLNLRRCAEIAAGEWLWITGDDDAVKSDAVSTILKCVENSQSEVLYFSNPCFQIANRQVIDTVPALLESISLPGLALIGGTVYRREVLSDNLAGFGKYCPSLVPYLCITFSQLEAGKLRAELCPERLFAKDTYDTSQGWSSVALVEGLGNWISALNQPANKSALADRLWFLRKWGLQFGERELNGPPALTRWRCAFWLSGITLAAHSKNPVRTFLYKMFPDCRDILRWLKGALLGRNLATPIIIVACGPAKWILSRARADGKDMVDIF